MQQKSQDFEFSLEHEAKPDVLRLILNTKFGTEGGLRYRHGNMEERIADLHQPDFLVLRKEQKAVGTTVYCKRSFHFQGRVFQGFYIRYFSVASGLRGHGIGTALMSHAEKHYRSTVKERAVFYGYIELENIRSMRASETYELSSIRKFQTVLFSRLLPKKHPCVQKITEEDKVPLLDKLKNEYREYAFVNFNPILQKNNVYVYKEKGEILAGAHTNTVRWIFEYIPGFSGWMIKHIVPHTPILGRLSNPGNYLFTSFEGIYSRPGHEEALVTLFEHVLAENGHYTGMTWMDTRSPLLARIKDYGKLGLLNRVQKSPPASIVAQFTNVSQNEKEAFLSKPAYISAFDLT